MIKEINEPAKNKIMCSGITEFTDDGISFGEYDKKKDKMNFSFIKYEELKEKFNGKECKFAFVGEIENKNDIDKEII